MSARTADDRKTKYGNLRPIAAVISIAACALFAIAWIASAFDRQPDQLNWLFEAQQSHGLKIEQTSSGYVLMIPHWLPIVFTGMLAIALVPSVVVAFSSRLLAFFSRAPRTIRRIQLPRQFSLRALLIIITMLALVIGLVGSGR